MVPVQIRVPHLVLLLCVLLQTACSSLQTYPAHELGADLPIAEGDEIIVYPLDISRQPETLIVTSMDAASIAGRSNDDGGAVLIYRWDSIARIEHRRFDGRKSAGLALLAGAILYAGKEFADGVGDLFDGTSSDD